MQAQNLADALVFQVTKKHLGDAEITVLRGAWDGKTYDAIAAECHLTLKYVGEVGGKLWNNLSEVLGEEVKKTNFRQALQREWYKQGKKSELTPDEQSGIVTPEHTPLPKTPESGELYIERPPIESRCYEEICKPGALLRVKAPLQFGKTELMSRVMHHAAEQGYRTIVLNLRDAIAEDFTNLDKFLQWFITSIAETLSLTQPVEEHWRKSLGNCKIKCRTYFEKYLLPGDTPVACALDEVDKLFVHGEIAGEFLGMLRTWHEDAKTKPLWRQLRLLVLHTEVYTQLNINQSPFNAGTEIKLTDFSAEQVQDLAIQYKLNWGNTQLEQLMAMVGGHPYLTATAIQVVARQDMTVQTMARLKKEGFACVASEMRELCLYEVTEDEFYGGFATNLVSEFNLDIDLEGWWYNYNLIHPVQRLTKFIEEILLEQITQNIVIFVDEIDSVLNLEFKDDFFAFVRACYNKRADKSKFNRLTFALLGVATPADLIADKEHTPFNIESQAIELTGFQLEEATPLSSGLVGITSNPDAVLASILGWTGGQPFLTQWVCSLYPPHHPLLPELRLTALQQSCDRVFSKIGWHKTNNNTYKPYAITS
ncbi:AAA-like domain-containing protein [Iningainema tapete]|uniref:AAA-like domain-containing protein n=1 Tax=Iningainema tapete BLCC-T55 TaxID=2748662 RepID=A0A8J7C6J0_9CYAN|nr:AAA-like domain-containing protein [Iningainema tapete]MBD2774389.1 AAA-like domain-containing protein [Iningainema tapete BLCC-T55]